jgi:hypothetical protein
MRSNQQRLLWFGVSILGVLTLSPALFGQASRSPEATIPVPSDWSHRSVIFSRPATTEQAKRVEQDPRYWQQRYRRELPVMVPAAQSRDALASELRSDARVRRRRRNQEMKRDWQESLGLGASVGAGNFPAKFSFLGTTANCGNATQPDFVVYSTGLEGSATQASVVAYDNLYSGCVDLDLATAANFSVLASSGVTNTGNTVVTGANIGISPGSLTGFPPGVLTSPAVEDIGDTAAAQAQADASAAYTHYQGLGGATTITSPLDGETFAPGLYNVAASLALSAGQTVTLNGNGTYIFQIGSTLTLSGTVVLTGGATAGNVIWVVGNSATLGANAVAVGDILAQVSVTLDGGASLAGRAIALTGAVTMSDNAVTTVDTVPSVYWAYNTGGKILTSPAFSRDGTQVAFVETEGGFGILVLLKWAPSVTQTVGAPQTLTPVTAAAYPGCHAPCMTEILLSDSGSTQTDDTTSSVFVDFSGDTGWVGGASGWLHKITPLFKGVPAEVHNGLFPVQVNSANPTALSSPVHDYATGNVFVGDFGGYLYWVNSTSAAVTQSGKLDYGTGIVEGPIVDSTSGFVYVFSSSDGSVGCTGGAACSVVYQTNTTFTAHDVPTKAIVGTSTVTLSGPDPNPLYIGAFDSAYENSVDPPTGNLYVCGNTGGPPTLYQIPIAAGILPSAGIPITPFTTSATPACSPVTDVFNANATGGATEWLFVSVEDNGRNLACAAGGCLFNFEDTVWQPTTTYAVGQEVLALDPASMSSDLLFINVVVAAGTSGATTPIWTDAAGSTTTDGTVQWINQGPLTAAAQAVWSAGELYTRTDPRILDGNGNIEVVTIAGTTGGTVPTWSTIPGGTTLDGTVTWTNAGALGSFVLPATGGTSGIIVDNTVGSGTLLGTSQVYFSTLSDQPCGASGTGGCAVQASQSQLK